MLKPTKLRYNNNNSNNNNECTTIIIICGHICLFASTYCCCNFLCLCHTATKCGFNLVRFVVRLQTNFHCRLFQPKLLKEYFSHCMQSISTTCLTFLPVLLYVFGLLNIFKMFCFFFLHFFPHLFCSFWILNFTAFDTLRLYFLQSLPWAANTDVRRARC